MLSTTLISRLHGCLVGAAIGAELGNLHLRAECLQLATPADVYALQLEPLDNIQQTPGNIWSSKLTPFVALGVNAYLAKGGRVTPEDFAAGLRDDAGVAAPVFTWDPIHSIQEILQEGMHPRISGLGATPCGLICAAMPAVGIYHFNDPDYAYLDGVELSSVAQGRAGADWAALCAVAIAAAFNPASSPTTVNETTLHLALQNCPEIFYDLNRLQQETQRHIGNLDELASWWISYAGLGDDRKETGWLGYNPLRYVLPLLPRFSSEPRHLLSLIMAPAPRGIDAWIGRRPVSAIMAGALAGALHGLDVFPDSWRAWAEPLAAPWFPLTDVVENRIHKEREIITITERLANTNDDGMTPIQDKIYGCILAGAIGNAMGSPVEGQLYPDIDAQYPEHVLTVLEPHRLETEDDNQMAMLLTETYLARAGLPVMARHFGKTWAERLNRDHFFPFCMGHAYDLIRAGWDPRITGHWIQVTGSTVMCMEPVGIYHLADPEYAAIDATAISYMYQRGADVTAATMLAATVSEALQPRATVDSVLQAALDVAPRGPLHSFDKRAFASAYDYISCCLDIADKYDDVFAVRAELYEKCLFYHMIDPLELWAFALVMFKIAHGDVRLAAIGGTNIGRDSDTIAGRAAMLSGAIHGAANVPAEWVAMFKPTSLEKIKRNAGVFADLVVTHKLARLSARQ